MPSDAPGPDRGRSLHADALAWVALLAHWMDVARAARATAVGPDGGRWSAAVPHVIVLQALAFALRDIARVRPEDRAVARDRAAVQMREAATALGALWHGEPMPEDLLERIEEAERAWRASAYPGLVELTWPGPGELVMPELEGEGGTGQSGGTLLAMAPGTVVLPGEPVAFVSERPLPHVPGTEPRPAAELAQLYRTFDEGGRWTGSFRRPVDDELPAGMPMLLPLWVQGEPVAKPVHPPARWLAMQRAAGISLAAWQSLPRG